MDVMSWLFDKSMGSPGPAGHFPLWLSICYHGSHVVLSVVFFLIPVLVSSHWKYRRDGVSPWEYWGVMGLFLSIGGKSAARVLEVWGPPYHLVSIVDVLAAALAVASLPNIISLITHVMKLPSRGAVHDLAGRLNLAMLTARVERDELADRNRYLLSVLADFETKLTNEGWTHEKSLALAEIRGMLKAGNGSKEIRTVS